MKAALLAILLLISPAFAAVDGTVVNVGAGGPCAKLNTPPNWLVGFNCWLARTGRFWVTVCPKIEPNTPMSKLRP